MDWSSSGIEHEWQYQLVSGDTFAPMGWLTTVTGGKITEGWRTDLRTSCTLSLDGGDIPLNCAVRVWHVASYRGEEVRELLGTFHPDPFGGTYEYGRMTGDVQLYSSLSKLSNARWKGTSAWMKKGQSVIAQFKRIAGWCYVPAWVTPSWKTSATFASTWVWVYATDSAYKGAQVCADAIGGYLGVDAEGRVTLTPYTAPSKMPQTWTIPTASIVALGVDVDVPSVVNKVTAKYENNGKTYTSEANVASTHPWAESRIRRVMAEELTSVTIQEGSSIQTQLDKATKSHLASVSDMKRTFSVDTLYSNEVRCGTVGLFEYRDSPNDEGIRAKVFCSAREINLDYKADMSLTLEEL